MPVAAASVGRVALDAFVAILRRPDEPDASGAQALWPLAAQATARAIHALQSSPSGPSTSVPRRPRGRGTFASWLVPTVAPSLVMSAWSRPSGDVTAAMHRPDNDGNVRERVQRRKCVGRAGPPSTGRRAMHSAAPAAIRAADARALSARVDDSAATTTTPRAPARPPASSARSARRSKAHRPSQNDQNGESRRRAAPSRYEHAPEDPAGRAGRRALRSPARAAGRMQQMVDEDGPAR